MPQFQNNFSLLIIGGGLSGLMTAYFWLAKKKLGRVGVIESRDMMAGDHTWSFFKSDLSDHAYTSLNAFVEHEWPQYSVVFPGRRRTLRAPYASGNSASLNALISPMIKQGVLVPITGQKATNVSRNEVTLSSGETLSAKTVLDARGGSPDFLTVGYQKFFGKIVQTDKPHGLTAPIIMDATVPQKESYRFFYCLPYNKTQILIEDTRYSDEPDLEDTEYSSAVDEYAASQGWQIVSSERNERGILPITLASDVEKGIAEEADKAPRIGLAGGLFNAATGYSLPNAVRLAERLASSTDDPQDLATCIHNYRREHWRAEAFYRMLNRMLFAGAEPNQRYKVLERFYGLGDGLIRRFYAGQLTFADKSRILVGKPPIRLDRAIVNLNEQRFLDQRKNA